MYQNCILFINTVLIRNLLKNIGWTKKKYPSIKRSFHRPCAKTHKNSHNESFICVENFTTLPISWLRLGGVLAETRTEDLWITSLGPYRCIHPVSVKIS
jgi:hypothetical protein